MIRPPMVRSYIGGADISCGYSLIDLREDPLTEPQRSIFIWKYDSMVKMRKIGS